MATDPALRVLAHPLRLRMLSRMWATPMSAAGLAEAFGIGHGLASQHLRRLADAGLVELAEVRPKRGGRERLYRTVHGSPLSDRTDGAPLLAEALAGNLRHRADRRAPGRGATTDAEMWVAPATWDRFLTDLSALVDGLHEQAQPTASPGTVPVALTLMAFRMREDEA